MTNLFLFTFFFFNDFICTLTGCVLVDDDGIILLVIEALLSLLASLLLLTGGGISLSSDLSRGARGRF